MTRMGKAAVAGSAVLVATGALASGAFGGAQASNSQSVSVRDSKFVSKSVTITKGESVTFKWSVDNARPHDVKFTKVPEDVNKKSSGEATPFREAFKYRPPKTGTYRYVCTVHFASDSMAGKIVVNKPN